MNDKVFLKIRKKRKTDSLFIGPFKIAEFSNYRQRCLLTYQEIHTFVNIKNVNPFYNRGDSHGKGVFS